MAFSAQWDSAARVLRVTGAGSGTLVEARDILETLRALTVPAERAAILLDVRAYDYLPSGGEARVIAEWFSTFSMAFQCRIAYLTTPGAQFGIGRMVQIISELRGAAAGAFTDEPAALRWLHLPEARSHEATGA